ncbi:glutamyl-tRNA(Gln) amidotransferase subunit C, mitochondrial [Trichoplusia ni]|uniref:Glutamyl-tRNA(Gln) amidotransferase subunit C, mitochondrial n=1 Tax=Trichoplusia ni TaxID=7111 RepID=A0A7E5VAJ9_TRINI|nr:glutamyl-tRNA(Gln) amidotransferase subunit C, mitochondrial [Trichoplusia ni]
MIFFNLIKRTPRTLSLIKTSCRNLNSKIPTSPTPSLAINLLDPVKIDRHTVLLLERLSLVSYNTEQGIKILEDTIAFADQVLHINTDDVEPLYSVLEEENLFLRQDQITQGNCQKDILRNAAMQEDDYFVAPIGNIPLHEIDVDYLAPRAKQHEN